MENLNLTIADKFCPPKLKKDRTEYFKQRYTENKSYWNQKYAMKKEQEQKGIKETNAKYYEAESIKILMSLKEYTELNKDKMKSWADFCWTLKDCQKGMSDIVFIMKLREVAETLINDYWKTAKNEIRKGKSWNSLECDQQQRLIKYWGREKARQEKELANKLAEQEKQGKTHEKELELAKFHEERGKIKCDCWQCEESKKLQAEIKEEMTEENRTEKMECSECRKMVKELDGESGVCKKCLKEYGGGV